MGIDFSWSNSASLGTGTSPESQFLGSLVAGGCPWGGGALENRQWAACGLTPPPPSTLYPSPPPAPPPRGSPGCRHQTPALWHLGSQRMVAACLNPGRLAPAPGLPDPCVQLCTLTCVCMCVSSCVLVYVCECVSLCMRVYMRVCVSMHVCAHVYVCLRVNLCVHTPAQACPRGVYD